MLNAALPIRNHDPEKCFPRSLLVRPHHTSRRYRSQHYSIGPYTTIITDVDLSEELSAGANEDVMPNAWGPTPPSQITQGYPMVEGTAFSYDSFGMHDDTTKVMDA